jgi:cullin 3
LDLFRDTIVRSQNYPIQTHLLEVLLQQIKLERENEIIDRTNVKASIDMLLELTDASTKDTVYATDFENRFLDTSSEYYRVEGQMLVGEYDAPEYMKKVRKYIYIYMFPLKKKKNFFFFCSELIHINSTSYLLGR